uniref:Uncharacterized protein n=1 Tax=Timema poppense TaxID=170557 RepID=A0A7R9HCL9_TIMPO|nr:unnamed protein product [Timema poppensis]
MINSDTEVGLHLFVMSANVSSIDHTAPVTKLSGSRWAREMGEQLSMWSQREKCFKA